MKKTLIFPILVMLSFTISQFSSNAQSVLWAKKGSSPGFENGNAVVADDSGNVYVTGQIEYTSTFDSYSLTSAGQHDIFVAKYNAAGVIVWIRRAGGTDGDIGLGIGIDALHNVYITGEIEQTVQFGNNISLTSSGGNDVFIAKYDANGNVKWAKRFGHSASSDKGRAIAVSPSGNCYITGNFSETVTIGSTSLSSSGGNDIFIAKYDAQGNAIWAKKAGGSKQDRGYGIAIDNSENVYVTGSFTSPATFKTTTITNSGKLSAFVAKYSSGGTFQWVKSGGDCCDTTEAYAITLDTTGNIFITGSFAVKTKFSSFTLTSSGLIDIFVAKYSNSGTLQWAKKAGGSKEDIGYGIKYAKNLNRVYVTGFVASTGHAGSLSYPFAGYKDVFLASYSASSGSEKWVKTYGGTRRDIGLAITTNSQGFIYTTGLFNGTVNFGGITLTGYTNSYWADFFLNKILPPVLPAALTNENSVSDLGESESIMRSQLDAQNSSESIRIYPNPFKRNFTISVSEQSTLTVYDMYGKIVESRVNIIGDVTGGEEFSDGIYLVEVSNATNRKVFRIIKSHLER